VTTRRPVAKDMAPVVALATYRLERLAHQFDRLSRDSPWISDLAPFALALAVIGATELLDAHAKIAVQLADPGSRLTAPNSWVGMLWTAAIG
jgi:hypothetical protein